MGGVSKDLFSFPQACSQNALQRGELSASDVLSCLPDSSRAAAEPRGEGAGQNTLDSASVEGARYSGGKSKLPESPLEAPLEAMSLMGSFDSCSGVCGP